MYPSNPDRAKDWIAMTRLQDFLSLGWLTPRVALVIVMSPFAATIGNAFRVRHASAAARVACEAHGGELWIENQWDLTHRCVRTTTTYENIDTGL